MERGLLRVEEAADRAKSGFLDNMEHELRTPLTSVIGFANLLCEDDLTETQRGWAENIKNGGMRLLGVVNDILEFISVETDGIELSMEEFDVRGVVNGVFESASRAAAAKRLGVECRVADGVPDKLLGDASRLQKAIAILVGNAVKFTDTGSVRLEIDLAPPRREGTEGDGRGGERTVRLRFAVSDTGIGIPAHLRGEMFKPFTQADGSRSRRHEGVGLGLTICRRIVEGMGGAVQVESEPGKGSVFTFTAVFGVVGEAGSTVRSSPRFLVVDAAPARP